jgi:hypothetical protein
MLKTQPRYVPRYPIYVISKGRHDQCLTANFLVKDGVPFHLVVEPQEADLYIEKYGKERVFILPFSNLGLGGIPARNWVKDHATKQGHVRHWILDDNIRDVQRWYDGDKRITCHSGTAFAVAEDFTDRYENVAISGLNYAMWAFHNSGGSRPPFNANVHVYSCLLILNSIPHKWRGRYNEDTDLCLQVLADGWCTILINAFVVRKVRTMAMKGGNSDLLYKGDGRLKMARSLERMWPGVVEVGRRFKRPQHVVKYSWGRFDTPLKLKKGINLAKMKPNEYGLKLVQVAPVVKNEGLQKLLKEHARV